MAETVAIIGGTGVYNLDTDAKTEIIKTEFGNVEVSRMGDVVFLNRHAPKHSIPPHKINYRANIKALDILGVKRICATFAVGIINEKFKLGTPIIVSDFIDMTSGREHSFFDKLDNAKGHVDMSNPFCPVLSQALEDVAKSKSISVKKGGVYMATNGPRFESPAEIKAWRLLGADMVGMTLCPEIGLALELGMSYAGFAYGLNWGAGMTDVIEIQDDVEGIKTKMLDVMITALAQTKNTDCIPASLI